MLYNVCMDTIENAPHQMLVDGLGYHVLKGEISQERARFIIDHYQRHFPDEDYLDEGILFSIRKQYGLNAPPSQVEIEHENWEKQRDTEASINCAGSYRRVVGGQ